MNVTSAVFEKFLIRPFANPLYNQHPCTLDASENHIQYGHIELMYYFRNKASYTRLTAMRPEGCTLSNKRRTR